jgi:hypothetical protein
MASIVIAGDTSGTVTLAAPATAGTTTLTLPTTDGTVLTTTGGVVPGSNGNVLTSDGTNWTSAALPAGGVTSLNGQTGAITSTNYNAIGSYFVATNASYGPNATIDSTISGSSLNIQTSDSVFTSAGLTGTWRAMGGSAVRSNSGAGLFVRIS